MRSGTMDRSHRGVALLTHSIRSSGHQVISRQALALTMLLAWAPPALAHEGGAKKPPPPAAKRDLETARQALDAAKARLTADGRYACCVKPACDLCARATGSCACAANLLAGKGVC